MSMDLQAFSSGVDSRKMFKRCEGRIAAPEPAPATEASTNPFAEEGDEDEDPDFPEYDSMTCSAIWSPSSASAGLR